MGIDDMQYRIWLLHMQFLHPCLMPHMTGENGYLDLCLFIVHECSSYFCYEFCCLYIYPVYFHQIPLQKIHFQGEKVQKGKKDKSSGFD